MARCLDESFSLGRTVVRTARLCLALVLYIGAVSTSSSAQVFDEESIGVWNGFLGHRNVVECSNLGENTVGLELTVRRNDGSEAAHQAIQLAAKATYHFSLNDLVGPELIDAYGTYRVRRTGPEGEQMTCHTMFYQFDPQTSALNYAFSIPVGLQVEGETTGIYNSINPNQTQSSVVLNWLSIVNLSSQPFSATIEVLDDRGALVQEIPLEDLPPGARADRGVGHDRGFVTGLYRIRPLDPTQTYASFLTRISQNDNGTYAYAMPFFARRGLCDSGLLPASSMNPAYNWGEVANTTNQPVRIHVEVTDQTGASKFSEDRDIPPFSQSHFPLHAYLGVANIGTFSVTCDPSVTNRESVAVQSVFYGRRAVDDQDIVWAYATQPLPVNLLDGDKVFVQGHTLLGSANWLKFLNAGATGIPLTTDVWQTSGAPLAHGSLDVPAKGSRDWGLHEATGSDAVFLAATTVGGPANVFAESIRVFPTKGLALGYITNVRASFSSLANQSPTGCTHTAHDHSASVVEHRDSLVQLPGTGCALSRIYQVTQAPSSGAASINSAGVLTYRSNWDVSADSLQYRVCSAGGAACSDPATVTLNITPAPDFSGSGMTLAPYRENISAEERKWIVEKAALNQRLLLQGADSMTLSQFIDQRLLDDNYIAPDLRASLIKLRDRNAQFATPNISFQDEWITVVDNPRPAMGTPTRYILPGDQLSTPQAVRAAFDRVLYTTTRETHGSCSTNPDPMSFYEYYWSNNLLSTYLIQRARYYSPFHTLMVHFWMSHFGVHANGINGNQEHYIGHFTKILEREATNNFRRMLIGTTSDGCGSVSSQRGLICDALTNFFLDNHLNTVSSPNQNYARELMELFTLTPIDSRSGLPNYTDVNDVISAAAYLSGYQEVNPGSFSYLAYMPARHDSRPYSMFTHLSGVYPEALIINQSMTPRQFVSHLLDNHPSTALFIARKLVSMLVTPNPPEEAVEEIAADLQESGYELRPVLRKLLRSEMFFSAQARGGNCVEEPFKYFMRMINGLSIPLLNHYGDCTFSEHQKWTLSYSHMTALMASAGEKHLGAPSVFNYDYCGRSPGKDGAKEWQPSSKILNRIKGVVDFIAQWGASMQNDFRFASLADRAAIRYGTAIPNPSSPGQYIAGPNFTRNQLIDFVAELLSAHIATNERNKLDFYLTHRIISGQTVSVAWNPIDRNFLEEKVVGLITTIMSLPSVSVH